MDTSTHNHHSITTAPDNRQPSRDHHRTKQTATITTALDHQKTPEDRQPKPIRPNSEASGNRQPIPILPNPNRQSLAILPNPNWPWVSLLAGPVSSSLVGLGWGSEASLKSSDSTVVVLLASWPFQPGTWSPPPRVLILETKGTLREVAGEDELWEGGGNKLWESEREKETIK